MPSVSIAARPIRPLEIIYEDELGDAAPMAHALFLPKDKTLSSAPFPVAGQSGLPDAVTLTAASSSLATRRTVTSNWRSRRSVSRMRYGKQDSESHPTWRRKSGLRPASLTSAGSLPNYWD